MIWLQTYFMLVLHTPIYVWNAITMAWCWTLFEEMKKETIIAGFWCDPQNSARLLQFPAAVIFRKTSRGFFLEESCGFLFNRTFSFSRWQFDNGLFYENNVCTTKEKWLCSYRARLAFRKHRPFLLRTGL